MSVFRVEKNKGYTVMSNHHLRNHTLSLKAKGLLSQMLSLPEDWDYTLKGLAQINRESIDAIREAVRELEQAGYITRSRERDARGCLRGTVYTIYEQPHTEPTPEEPTQEKPAVDNPTLEKPMLDTDDQHMSSIASFNFGFQGGITKEKALVEYLQKRNIYISLRSSTGTGGLRISVHYYNTPEEIDTLVAAIGDYMQQTGVKQILKEA